MKKISFIFFLFSLILFSCKSNKLQLNNYNLIEKNTETINTQDIQKNSFSIAVIPDTQSYLDFRCQKGFFFHYPINQYELYLEQMKFIAENSVNNNGIFDFAIHLGDIVDHRGWNMTEWKRAVQGFEILNNQIPFLTVIGNHDYDNWKKGNIPVGTKLYNKYFGPESSFYKNQPWFGGATSNGANSWAIFSTSAQKILVLGLELDPNDEVLDWAQNVININKGLPTIIVTHSYLDITKSNNNQNKYTKAYSSYNNNAEDVWKKFISKNDQIFLVLCGHSSSGDIGEGLRVDINDFGHKTYSILSDYQTRNNYLSSIGISRKTVYGCGDGWMRILTFELDKKRLHVQTYSTAFNCFETDEDSDYYLEFDWDWKKRFSK